LPPNDGTVTIRPCPASVISPLALEAVRRIDALFEIERAINGQSTEWRRAVRQELSAPLIVDLERGLREERPKLSRHAESAKAVDPQAWLADVPARIAGHPAHRIDALRPGNWRPGSAPRSQAA
jgi:Transposase IS66 family